MRIVRFKGIDNWNRPVFKQDDKSLYFGSTEILFNWGATEEEVLEKINASSLEYFGDSFDCEPNGGIVPNLIIKRKGET